VPTSAGHTKMGLGVTLVLNELGLAAGGVSVFGALLALSEDHRKSLVSAGADLIRSLGAIDVLNRTAVWSELIEGSTA